MTADDARADIAELISLVAAGVVAINVCTLEDRGVLHEDVVQRQGEYLAILERWRRATLTEVAAFILEGPTTIH